MPTNNNNNDPVENVNDPNLVATNANSNNNSKSASSAEGTRRVKPGKGTAKTPKEIEYAVKMKRAKKVLNDALGIKSMPPEHNPLVKIMNAKYNNESNRKAAINAHIEKIKKAREEKATAKAATTAPKARKTKTAKKNNNKKNKNTAPATPASNGKSTTAKRSKREAPTEKEGKLKENMHAAKKILNDRLGIKSMPPEFNPLMTIMRKTNLSESAKREAINAHVEKVKKARNEKAAAKKATKGGTRKNRNRKNTTRKNRRS